jgi:hypothetical protein
VPKPSKSATRPPKKEKPLYRQKPALNYQPSTLNSPPDLPHAKPLAPSHFELREDGTIAAQASRPSPSSPNPPQLVFTSENPFVRLYQGNCLELLDAIAAKYPEGRFDAIFADPPSQVCFFGIKNRLQTAHSFSCWYQRRKLRESHSLHSVSQIHVALDVPLGFGFRKR